MIFYLFCQANDQNTRNLHTCYTTIINKLFRCDSIYESHLVSERDSKSHFPSVTIVSCYRYRIYQMFGLVFILDYLWKRESVVFWYDNISLVQSNLFSKQKINNFPASDTFLCVDYKVLMLGSNSFLDFIIFVYMYISDFVKLSHSLSTLFV